jgi:spore coat polysaccharide biosynthesis predicted glycosyltransferase SpsG
MRVAFLVLANERTGLGHWYRSLALAQEMQDEGHEVEIWSDRDATPFVWLDIKRFLGDASLPDLLAHNLDWLVIDLPHELNRLVVETIHLSPIKTLVLNGVGHEVGDWATLRIVQGFSDAQYSGPEFVILRRNVFEAAKVRNPVVDWFVFGGAADGMHLTRLFPNWNRITYIVSADRWGATDSQDAGFLPAAAQCKQACIAMGMTAWELAAMGVPAYVVSISKGHLDFALQMQEAGLVKAFDAVGMPPLMAFERWLQEPFEITGKPPDGQAGARIMELMGNV